MIASVCHTPMRRGRPEYARPNSLFLSFSFGHCGVEPGAGIAPGTVGGGQGNAQADRRLRQGQAAEEAKLDELGLEWVVEPELLQGLVQGQELLRRPADAEGVEIRLLDEGAPFDLSAVPVLNPAELRIGGRGVFLMRALMDELSCQPRGEQGNTLRMVKHCNLTPPVLKGA